MPQALGYELAARQGSPVFPPPQGTLATPLLLLRNFLGMLLCLTLGLLQSLKLLSAQKSEPAPRQGAEASVTKPEKALLSLASLAKLAETEHALHKSSSLSSAARSTQTTGRRPPPDRAAAALA